MPTAPAAPSPARTEPLRAHDELTLAALLDLLEIDADDVAPAPAPVPAGTGAGRAWCRDRARGVDSAWRSARVWTGECRRRAARWGIGPGGAWRAW